MADIKISELPAAAAAVGSMQLEANNAGTSERVTITQTETLLNASTATLTNKTINLGSNTFTGTTAQFNTALSDGSFATLAGTETLTNKTLALGSNTISGTTAQFNTALTDGTFITTDAQVETSYNNQVSVVSQAEAEAGIATTVRRWTAERVGQAIAALGGGSGDVSAAANITDNSVVRGDGGVKGVQESKMTIGDDGNVQILEPVNDGNPSILIGSSGTESWQVVTLYDGGAQTHLQTRYQTLTTSADANAGQHVFFVNGSLSGSFQPTGMDIATGLSYAINDVDVLTATTLGSSVVNSSLTSVGTITSGTWTGTAIANANLGDMASYTLKLRNAGTTGDPQDVKISALTEELTPTSGDFLLGELSTGELVRVDVGNLPTGGGGEANTGANQGAGIGVFRDKTGVTLNFNSLVGSTGIDVTLDDPNDEIDIAIDSTVATLAGAQTLTNKTIALGSNTVTGTTAEFNTSLTDNDFATLAGTETLTNKTLRDFSNEVVADGTHIQARNTSGVTMNKGDVVYVTGYNVGADLPTIGLADADGTGTFPAIGIVSETIANNANGEVCVSGRMTGLDTSAFTAGDGFFLSTTAGDYSAKPTAVTAEVQRLGIVLRSNATLGVVEIVGAGRTNDVPNKISDSVFRINDNADTTKLVAFEASGVTTATTRTLTVPDADLTIVGTTTTQTLTNKTLALGSNTISGTTAQFNVALTDGSFATLAGTETLTNKTIALGSNTVSGTTAQFNTALTDDSFATLAGTETLTNKTLDDAKFDIAINTQTGTTYTLVLADSSKIVEMNNAAANTLTIPTKASVAFPIGTMITVTQLGAGATTVDGDTGVTVNGVSAGGGAIDAQYDGVSLYKRGTDEWVVQGAIGAIA